MKMWQRSGLLIGLLFSILNGYPQQMDKLSLSKELIKPGILNFNIRIVDIRSVKSGIGTLQKGVTNSLRVATFTNPLEAEFSDLIYRSCGKPKTTVDVALGVRFLNISESTTNTSEYALAELTVDFFLVFDDHFYFVNRKHATYRSKAFDVTHQHETNIAQVLESVLKQFVEVDIEDQSVSSDGIRSDELENYQPPLQEVFVSILEDANFPDGVYMSFDEFKNNKPSVWDGYEIKEGSEISFKWIDEKGKKIRNAPPVYAIAYKNKLYKYFNNEFYRIEKRGKNLMFVGNSMVSPQSIGRAAAIGGLAGIGVNQGLGNKVRMVYEIDLNTGVVKERGFTK
jgi:hypothetical protein